MISFPLSSCPEGVTSPIQTVDYLEAINSSKIHSTSTLGPASRWRGEEKFKATLASLTSPGKLQDIHLWSLQLGSRQASVVANNKFYFAADTGLLLSSFNRSMRGWAFFHLPVFRYRLARLLSDTRIFGWFGPRDFCQILNDLR